jgi:hypothetical protein
MAKKNQKKKEEKRGICDLCGELLGTGEIVLLKHKGKEMIAHRYCADRKNVHFGAEGKNVVEVEKKGDKKMKKTDKKKVTKKKKTAAKKETAKKTDKKKKTEKKTGIGKLVRKMIQENKKYDDIEKAVKKEFPDSRFNKAHYYWYKANLEY